MQPTPLSNDVRNQLAEPHEALFRLISLTARDLRTAVREIFRSAGITGVQFGVLLGAAQGRNIATIAAQILTDPTSIGRVIERMERAGLVRRFRRDDDRRAVWVELLPPGEEILRQTLPLHVERCHDLLAFLGPSGQAELVALLGRIRNQVAADESFFE